MSLIDQTSNYQFGVQKRGGSSFQTQSVTQTASGKDKNGTTKDFRIKLPSQDSIIRCSMYVKPMGRNVIFYFYLGNYTQGNTVGMKAKIVIGEASTKQTSKQEDTTEATTQATDLYLNSIHDIIWTDLTWSGSRNRLLLPQKLESMER